MVRGPEGTPVTLKVIHPGENSLTEITIIRGKITVHPVSWAMLPGTDIAHLRLSQFNANAGREIVAAIKELKAAGARGVGIGRPEQLWRASGPMYRGYQPVYS